MGARDFVRETAWAVGGCVGEGGESAFSTFNTSITFKRAFKTRKHSITAIAVMLCGVGVSRERGTPVVQGLLEHKVSHSS